MYNLEKTLLKVPDGFCEGPLAKQWVSCHPKIQLTHHDQISPDFDVTPQAVVMQACEGDQGVNQLLRLSLHLPEEVGEPREGHQGADEGV
jgi:hypothetical protein